MTISEGILYNYSILNNFVKYVLITNIYKINKGYLKNTTYEKTMFVFYRFSVALYLLIFKKYLFSESGKILHVLL